MISVIVFTVIFSYFAFSNFVKFDDKFFSKNINLGLDLQGGSYLLLEIDNTPVIEQKLQNLTILLRNYFKEKNIRLKNVKLFNQTLSFSIDNKYKETLLNEFNSKESQINPYYERFKSHQLEINEEGDIFKINYSKMISSTLQNHFLDSNLATSLQCL